MRFALASALLLGCLFGVNVYRANTQSITIDEAFTYNHFVAAREAAAVRDSPYNNNLNTWLCMMMDKVLPPSELTLRLPSLLGGLLYFVALIRLCRVLFGDTIWLFLAVALNSLNPFVLDYLSAARGYGLGLAFLTAGVFYIVRCVDKRQTRLGDLIKAGVFFGLAIDSHITVLFAVMAIEVTVVVLLFRDGQRAWHDLIRWVGLPAIVALVVASPGLWLALRDMRIDRVDGVEPTFWIGIRSLMLLSFLYKTNILTAAIHGLWGATDHFATWLLPCLLAALLICGALAFWRWRADSRNDRMLAFYAGTVLLTFLLLRIEPAVSHHGYFAGRRLLFTLPLTFTALPLMLRWLWDGSLAGRTAALSGGIVAIAILVNFAADFNYTSYCGWEQDSATAKAISVLSKNRPPNMRVHLGVSPFFVESVNYYQRVHRLDWLAEATRASQQCFYQFYYVQSRDFPALSELGAWEIFHDGRAGTILAAAGSDDKHPCLPDVSKLGSWVELHGPTQGEHLLHDFATPAAGDDHVWTYERPVLAFYVPKRSGVKFKMEFQLAGATLKETGPVGITFWLNGKPLATKTYDTAGMYTVEQDVPLEFLREDGIAIVETSQDKYYTGEGDGQRLSYLFHAAGFVE